MTTVSLNNLGILMGLLDQPISKSLQNIATTYNTTEFISNKFYTQMLHHS